jgi:hypothetical protein
VDTIHSPEILGGDPNCGYARASLRIAQLDFNILTAFLAADHACPLLILLSVVPNWNGIRWDFQGSAIIVFYSYICRQNGAFALKNLALMNQ